LPPQFPFTFTLTSCGAGAIIFRCNAKQGREIFRPIGEIHMGIESIIVWLIVGAIAGWLAGIIVTGYGFGLIGNIVVGIVGAVIAGWLLPRLGLGLPAGIVGSIIYAAIGAIILLVIIGLVRRA
jgi:uncharacterized membrane protein YeaQ/YmgE (transglycosylase-associated protein family)